ncbi:MAG: putative dihydroorotate dehydrogenase B (NAD(+)), electron transfer subunit [Candidatus Magasanikbacteria bacterium GW2011_GWC2_34_16]|uniref:Putative dihydroorotate dehydrogenase B (NAD(+)), electron transfer subunit n=2 Tax=Candidatus Magasanikiibacteriota TaxID=1752731 RepID=A0A0G0HD67_9BACT|nr:MAG: putative dihydroorotate dehydrogenase B (NAD(+)), electron transfer subunit [Candidatus Magasanikbacteria bacterium GW2011_GWC2_34_16]KKQ41093.1 MAG: putative dihydroorotate dehydrogenase B (NAD(+)), electron transfer subunit [Candidatus Magasanikbacteria bacterium GW2011_GWA2_37_8]
MDSTFIKISDIEIENSNVKTFYFDYELKSKPGQFIMLWIPGTDQKPFSVSFDNGQKFGLTIFKRGPATNKLFKMKIGDRVGINGPYGTNFTINPNLHYIMVAGGYGAAPLKFLTQTINGAAIDFIAGGRTKDNLLFEEELTKIPNLNLHITTDDGSKGYKGFVTDVLVELLAKIDPAQKDKTLVVTCGPELMQKKVLDICNEHNINCEVSIERYMKCGMGICGQCVIDDLGICMCKDGPVVNQKLANQIFEFGKYHRDKSGVIVHSQ